MSGCDNCCKQEENTQGKEVGTVTVGGRWGGKKKACLNWDTGGWEGK